MTSMFTFAKNVMVNIISNAEQDKHENWCWVGLIFHVIVTQLSGASCDHVANLQLHPTDLKHKIRIRRKRILAGSVTSII